MGSEAAVFRFFASFFRWLTDFRFLAGIESIVDVEALGAGAYHLRIDDKVSVGGVTQSKGSVQRSCFKLLG